MPPKTSAPVATSVTGGAAAGSWTPRSRPSLSVPSSITSSGAGAIRTAGGRANGPLRPKPRPGRLGLGGADCRNGFDGAGQRLEAGRRRRPERRGRRRRGGRGGGERARGGCGTGAGRDGGGPGGGRGTAMRGAAGAGGGAGSGSERRSPRPAGWKACAALASSAPVAGEVFRDEAGLVALVVEGERARICGLLAHELVKRGEWTGSAGSPPRSGSSVGSPSRSITSAEDSSMGTPGRRSRLGRGVGHVERDGSEVGRAEGARAVSAPGSVCISCYEEDGLAGGSPGLPPPRAWPPRCRGGRRRRRCARPGWTGAAWLAARRGALGRLPGLGPRLGGVSRREPSWPALGGCGLRRRVVAPARPTRRRAR